MKQVNNMKKLLLGAMMLLAVSCAEKKIDNVALFEGIVTELASPEFAGRSAYNNGELKTAEYIAAKFNELCTSDFVEKPVMQPFSYPINTTREDMAFSVDGTEYKPFQDFVVKEFSSGADRTMPIVYALQEEIYTPDKFSSHLSSLGAENSFVVLDYDKFHTLPSEGDRYFKYLKELNIGGVIFKFSKKPNYFKARSFFTTPFPVICVGPEFPEAAKEATVKFQNEFIEKHNSQNVFARIKGTSDSDSCWMFIAHYDHLGMMGKENVCLGANDNASGTAGVLTLAHYYSLPENRPELDMVFLWVGGEEANRGLDLFMQINKERGYFANPHRGELVDNSDHYYFAKAGVPAMYFESKGEYYKYYHSPDDHLGHFTSESYKMIFEMVKEFVNRY